MDKCFFCGNKFLLINDTHIQNIGDAKITINNVPTLFCKQCNEKYYSSEVDKNIDKIIESLKNSKSKLITVDYATFDEICIA